MPIATSIASVAVSAAVGALKLGKRLDEIFAEESALRSKQAVRFPDVVLVRGIDEMKRGLRRYEKDTRNVNPDPLADDRAWIVENASDDFIADIDAITAMYDKHGLGELAVVKLRPDDEFARLLRSHDTAWDLRDDDIRELTSFVAAGKDFRESSTSFRIAASVLDVFSEFTAANLQFVVRDPSTRTLITDIVTRFSAPDLASFSGWGGVLKQALRATLEGVVENRTLVRKNNQWIQGLLASLSRARDASPNQDEFFIGLLQGDGFRYLIRGALQESAAQLGDDDATALEGIIADVLIATAATVDEAAIGFDEWFHDNWNEVVGAALSSVATHGPRILDSESQLLEKTFSAAISALAADFRKGPPTGDVLLSALEAAIAVVADDPTVLEGDVGEEWVRDLLGSFAGIVRNRGLEKAFSRDALQAYVQAGFETLARHPELVIEDAGILQDLYVHVLSGIAKAERLRVDDLGTAAIVGALRAVEENESLILGDFGEIVGDFAGRIATLVDERKLSGIQGTEILSVGIEVIATNPELFAMAEGALAQTIVDAVLAASDNDANELLTGQALVATTRRILQVVAARGLLLGVTDSSEALTVLRTRMIEILGSGLSQASERLGRDLDRSMIPEGLTALIEAWSTGELEEDSGDEDIGGILDEVAAALSTVPRIAKEVA